VAGAVVTAELAAVLARLYTKWYASQMGTDAHGDKPVTLPGLGAVLEGLWIAQRRERYRIGFCDLSRSELPDEQRLRVE
jgi:hypothetical protein